MTKCLRGSLLLLLVLSAPAAAQADGGTTPRDLLGGLQGSGRGRFGSGIGSIGGRGGSTTAPRPPTVASEEVVAALAKELQEAAGKAWDLRRDRDTITLAMDVQMLPMGAFSRDSVETRTFRIVITLSAYLDGAVQRAKLDSAMKKERKLWRTVAALECREKSFSDHYEDGLCFRTKTDAEDRREAAYRQARAQLAEVPRFHRATAFAVSVRRDEPQLTDGQCGECLATAEKLTALFSAYTPRPK